MTTRKQKSAVRSSVSKLMLGGAMACLLAGPASATGWNYGGGDAWSGPYVGIGIGGVVQDADVKTSASRNDVTNLDVGLGFDSSISATLFPVSLMHDSAASASDAGVMGLITAGWDHRIAGSNFLLGAVFTFDWMNVESKFSSNTWAQGGASSINVNLDSFVEGKLYDKVGDFCLESKKDSFICGAVAGGVIGAGLANDFRDQHISVTGKVEQDYALQLGGRMGYIWNEVFMTYGGAAWTRTKTKVSATIDIADPLCGSDFLCKELGSPTQIHVSRSNDVDGYKLFLGGEYNVGGNWFLQGQASYSDLDGLNGVFSSQKTQKIFSYSGHDECGGPCIDINLDREMAEAAEISVDKEDYMVHAAVIYKFGAAPAPLAKPMK